MRHFKLHLIHEISSSAFYLLSIPELVLPPQDLSIQYFIAALAQLDKDGHPNLKTGSKKYKGIAPSEQDVRIATQVNFLLNAVTCHALIKT